MTRASERGDAVALRARGRSPSPKISKSRPAIASGRSETHARADRRRKQHSERTASERTREPSALSEEIAEQWDELRESHPILTVHAYGQDHAEGGAIDYVRVGKVNGRHEIEIESDSDDDDLDDFSRVLARSTHYQHTDAWRGYFATPSKTVGHVRVVETWVCPQGSGDAATAHQVPLERLFGRDGSWKDDGPPFEAIVVFARTSNVFSLGCDIYVRWDDRERALDYLTSRGCGEEVLVR